jgi:hypothetical protein
VLGTVSRLCPRADNLTPDVRSGWTELHQPELSYGLWHYPGVDADHLRVTQKVEGRPVYNELECYGGPLDGQTMRLRVGQYEVMVPFSTQAGGVRRFAVYSVRKVRGARRSSNSGVIERPLYVLMFTGEEWQVA